jgi:hypothetical protein
MAADLARTEILVDPRDAQLFPRGIPLTPDDHPQPNQLDLTTGGSPGGAVSLYFHVTLRRGPNFAFGWQNSAGALKEGKGASPLTPDEDGRRAGQRTPARCRPDP